MKLLNIPKTKLIGISNIIADSDESVQRFFTKFATHLEIINLSEEDVKSLQMPYLAFKGDMTVERPNSAMLFTNTYVNKHRRVAKFVVIKSLHTDCITLQLVAVDGDMRRIKNFLTYEPRISFKRKKAEYKRTDEKYIGKFFKSEFTSAERKLCYQLKHKHELKDKKTIEDVHEMLHLYYGNSYSLSDVVDAFDINFYNIADILYLIDGFRAIDEFRDALSYYKECLEEEKNSF